MTRTVYVIRAEGGPVKIGIASNPWKRLMQLRVGSFAALDCMYVGECVAETAELIEKEAHRHVAEFRRNGEWFGISVDEAIRAIEESAAKLGHEIKQLMRPQRRKSPGRPRSGRKPVVQIMVRIQPPLLGRIDEAMKQFPDWTRQDLIRHLIDQEVVSKS